jgi:hypothetical protein
MNLRETGILDRSWSDEVNRFQRIEGGLPADRLHKIFDAFYMDTAERGSFQSKCMNSNLFMSTSSFSPPDTDHIRSFPGIIRPLGLHIQFSGKISAIQVNVLILFLLQNLTP